MQRFIMLKNTKKRSNHMSVTIQPIHITNSQFNSFQPILHQLKHQHINFFRLNHQLVSIDHNIDKFGANFKAEKIVPCYLTMVSAMKLFKIDSAISNMR